MFQLPANAKSLMKSALSTKTGVSVEIQLTFTKEIFIFLLDNPRIWTQKNRSFFRQTQEIQIQRHPRLSAVPSYKLKPDENAAA